MTKAIKYAMVGAAGRMGQTIIELARQYQTPNGSSFSLTGAIDRPDSDWIGREVIKDVVVTDDLADALKDADVVIDFSNPENSLEVARYCGEFAKALVIGSTGINKKQLKQIESVADRIPLMVAPNMAVGVNLLFEITRLTARILEQGYDIEIVEAHHRFKKDAPSGTAMRLKEVLLEELGRPESNVIYGRQGITGERPQQEIGVHTIRGGDVVGDHTVHFLGDGERIELTHKASSRATFAAGALRAAAFLKNQTPGIFNMRDVLGLGKF